MRTLSETKMPKAKENADQQVVIGHTGDQVVICFSFASDWLRVVRVFWTNRRVQQSKIKAIPITFDIQFKNCLHNYNNNNKNNNSHGKNYMNSADLTYLQAEGVVLCL